MNEQLENSGDWTPRPVRLVSVWPHTLGEFERFPNSVAVVGTHGQLAVFPWDENTGRAADRLPLKVYAAGAWVTFEHIGDFSPKPQFPGRRPVQADPNPPTEEIPPVPADPFAQLDPDELARTNGDVSPSVGTGAMVPYPKPAAPSEPTGGPDEDVREGVVQAAPKAVSAADTAEAPGGTDEPEPPDWDAGALDLVKYLVGWPWRRPGWVRTPDLRRFWPRSSARPSLDSVQRLSPAGWMALLAALPLVVLVQTLL